MRDFYRPDELKYHGHGSFQRGTVSLDFLDIDSALAQSEVPGVGTSSNNAQQNNTSTSVRGGGIIGEEISGCAGHWRTPRNCDPNKHGDCQYLAR